MDETNTDQITENQDGDDRPEDTVTAVEDYPPSFDKELKNFIAHIASLSATLQIAMKAIRVALKNTLEELKEFEEKNTIYKEIEGKKALLVKADKAQELDDLTRQRRAYHLAFKTIPRSYIMALISQYDAFLGNLLRVIFLSKPELLNASERSLSFAQLVEYGSVEDAKEYILDKEIESVLRRSHSEQFQWMESKFGIPLRSGLEVWPQFIELTERRNLFVHTGGIVSNQYLKVCTDNNIDLTDVNKGDELSVSYEYFNQSYNAVFEIGIKLGHVFWRKINPDDLEQADLNLISIGYDTLYDENYHLTQMIFDFATQTLKTHAQDSSLRIMIVNRALAYKWGGNNDRAIDIISKEDWSATRARFRLAKAVILDNFDEAFDIMVEIGTNRSEVAKENYRSWPLFKAIKNEQKFLDIFEEIFSEPFNKVDEETLKAEEDSALDSLSRAD